MKVISYSIFGYNKEYPHSFSFTGYLRLFSINVMMADLIYPEWKIHLCIEQKSYKAYQEFFDSFDNVITEVLPEDDFCKMMLWRLRPAFDESYSRVICRDVDSLLHYRERQAVENWIPNGRSVHCIADSVSHNIPLMGGMFGVEVPKFGNKIGCNNWESMMNLAANIDFKQKGTDQQFLQKYILPKIAHDMVEHYVQGMPNSFRGAWYNFIQDDDLKDIDRGKRESNYLVSHIGQAGFAIDPVLLFINKWMEDWRKEYYSKIHKIDEQIHYWINDI